METTKSIQLAETLKALRTAYNYTQREISDNLNISRQAYSNYENNKRTPELDMLKKIIDFYGITFDHLLLGNSDLIAMEEKGPYHTALTIKNGETIYLAEREKNLIMKFRSLDSNAKQVVEGFLQSQSESSAKSKK